MGDLDDESHSMTHGEDDNFDLNLGGFITSHMQPKGAKARAVALPFAPFHGSCRSLDDSFASLNMEFSDKEVSSGPDPSLEDSTPSKLTVRFDESVSIRLEDSISTNLSSSEAKHEGKKATLNDSALQRISFESPAVVDDGSVEPSSHADSSTSEEISIPQGLKPSEEDDSPEMMIRRDTRTLRIFRVIVYLSLACVAAFAAAFVFMNTSNTEKESFRAEFDEISTRIVESFLQDTQSKLWMARTTAAFVTQLLELGTMSPIRLTASSFEDFASTQLLATQALSISWSPLLLTTQDRQAFEAFMAMKEPMAGLPGKRSLWDGIFLIKEDGQPVDDVSSPPYYPIALQSSTRPQQKSVMFNQYSDGLRADALDLMLASKYPIVSKQYQPGDKGRKELTGSGEQPRLLMFYPVFAESQDPEVVGAVAVDYEMKNYIQSSMYSSRSDLVDLVLENTCGQSFHYNIRDSELILVGIGNETTAYGNMVYMSTYEEFDTVVQRSLPSATNVTSHPPSGSCSYRLVVHATRGLEEEFVSSKPAAYAAIAVVVFVVTVGIFLIYDCLVSRRQDKVMEAAKRSTAIVSSLFPKNFRNRLYDEAAERRGSVGTGGGSSNGKGGGSSIRGDTTTLPSTKSGSSIPSLNNSRKFLTLSPRNRLKSYLESSPAEEVDSEPIADLFPDATVMFLDIAGFTAWSSEREPTQVFKLLETIYQSFDEATRKYRVFKIETIGDSYVAVTGVPDPHPDHALLMAKFACECLKRFNKLTKQLEVQLGPSTGELQARVGLHSGAVTGGVLRGEKARFQLFGDTMNTAARMESNGAPGHIQCSQATAELLVEAGKEHWLAARPDLVSAKGKGQMQTYWIEPSRKSTKNGALLHDSEDDLSTGGLDIAVDPYATLDIGVDGLEDASKVAKSMRLIDWNVETLFGFLQKIAASRDAAGGRPRLTRANSVALLVAEDETKILGKRGTAMAEVVDCIELPRFDPRAAKRLAESDDITLDPNIKEQLRDYVMRISSMYRDIPYHSFEHASHVAMSAAKLLGRVVNPIQGIDFSDRREHEIAKDVHQATFGISSDPLMQFSAVFAALIHDVDHTGLSNAQLVKLKTPSAIMYKNKSVAEQNSIDVAWTVLMDDDFDQLRGCIYSNRNELRRFRQLVVNAVMATDMSDEDLQMERHMRWEKAFEEEQIQGKGRRDASRHDRKATLIFEYMVQAASVAHSMQHWITYTKWNERLFEERFLSFMAGKEPNDPVLKWFDGELRFFDEIVIPLTEKLKLSGVFGASSNEFLNWALENRSEWELQGETILERMHNTCRANHPSSIPFRQPTEIRFV